MINRLFPAICQAASQTAGESPTMIPFSDTATLIDDEVQLIALGY